MVAIREQDLLLSPILPTFFQSRKITMKFMNRSTDGHLSLMNTNSTHVVSNGYPR
jgi:hypothetical protein